MREMAENTVPKLDDGDKVVSASVWTIMGQAIPVHVTAVGRVFVDGQPVHEVDERLGIHKTKEIGGDDGTT